MVPPFLLVRLADGQGPPAEAARGTLRAQRGLELRREAQLSVHPPGHRAGTPPTSGPTQAGIVPPYLRRSTDVTPPPAPSPTPGEEAPAPGEAPSPAAAAVGPRRSIHDAEQGDQLPGVLRRTEGDPPHADESVNEAYDGLGYTWTLFHDVYGRDSLDGAGLPLVASVHFSRNFNNAFWDGQQMVFGDGDGQIFGSFTDSVEVIGHELGHGFIQFTTGFVYVGQSGALNEHVADVFGVLTRQYQLRQSAQEADWLVGRGLLLPSVRGVALRSMKAPGTAYDDPRLGKDPQPGSLADYVVLPHDQEHDNGGVHINSGIPNRAFYLAATALGGNAWEKAGRIWYDVMTVQRPPRDVTFAGFAAASIAAAVSRYGDGSAETGAVRAAWTQVGVLDAGGNPVPVPTATDTPPPAGLGRAALRGGR